MVLSHEEAMAELGIGAVKTKKPSPSTAMSHEEAMADLGIEKEKTPKIPSETELPPTVGNGVESSEAALKSVQGEGSISVGRALKEGVKKTAKATIGSGKMSADVLGMITADVQKKGKEKVERGDVDNWFEQAAKGTIIQMIPGGSVAEQALKHIDPEVYRDASKKLDKMSKNKNLQLKDYVRPKGARGFSYDVVEAVPQFFGQIATTLLGGPVGGTTFMASQIAGGKYEKLLAEGVSPGRAAIASAADAALQAPLEQIGMSRVLKKWVPTGKVVSAIKEIGTTMGVEWFTETIQSMPELATDVWAKGKDKNFAGKVDDFIVNMWGALKQGAYEGLVAMVLGGGASGVNVAATPSKAKTSVPPPLPTEIDPAIADSVNRKLVGNETQEELDANPSLTEEFTPASIQERSSELPPDLPKEFKKRIGPFKKMSRGTKENIVEAYHGAGNYLGVVSTSLKMINPGLKHALRKTEFNTLRNDFISKKLAEPFLKKMKSMTPLKDRAMGQRSHDWSLYDFALKNGDMAAAKVIEKKYNMENEIVEVRKHLAEIREKALDVGINMGEVENYFPRMVKDYKGLMEYMHGHKNWGLINRALKIQEAGMTRNMTPQEEADYVNTLIRGYGEKLTLTVGKHTKARTIDIVSDEISEFYMDSEASLTSYLTKMNAAIEARKFFGQTGKQVKNLKRTAKGYRDDLAQLKKAANERDLEAYGNSEIAKAKKHVKMLQATLRTPFFAALKNNAKKQRELQDIKSEIDYTRDRVEMLEDIKTTKGFERYGKETIEALDFKLRKIEEVIAEKMDEGLESSIGRYVVDLVANGELSADQQMKLTEILRARFSAIGTRGATTTYKNLSYIATMGTSFSSAVTQLTDLAYSMAFNGLFNTLGEIGKSVKRTQKLKKTDIYIDRIAEEFTDPSTSAKAVDLTFKAVGLTMMDTLGKEVYINSALNKLTNKTKKNKEGLTKELRPIFGIETEGVIENLAEGEVTENVKLALFNELADVQPIALSEMPLRYLTAGNGRIFYMLKTYQLKLIDIYRNKLYDSMNSDSKKESAKAVGDMLRLSIALAICGGTADELKDLMMGRKTRLSDRVIDTILKTGGISRYTLWTARKEGITTAAIKLAVPPFNIIEMPFKDLITFFTDPKKLKGGKNLKSLGLVPVAGKLYDWWFGASSTYKKRRK